MMSPSAQSEKFLRNIQPPKLFLFLINQLINKLSENYYFETLPTKAEINHFIESINFPKTIIIVPRKCDVNITDIGMRFILKKEKLGQ